LISLARVFLPRFFLDFIFKPLEWISSPPLFASVLIVTKAAETPGSGCMGVIGALVSFTHPRPSRIDTVLNGKK